MSGSMNTLAPAGGFAPPPMTGTVVGAGKDGAPIIVINAPPSAGAVAANMDVLNTLVAIPGLYVARTVDLLEMLTGWERVNRYKLQPWDPERGLKKVAEGVLAPPFMKIKESSGCLCRICCGPERAFKMALYPYAEAQYPPPGADIFFLPGAITLERPWRCVPGFLPCNRPVLRVRHQTVGYLGEVRQPSCGPFINFHFDVFSPQRGPGSEDMLPGAPLHVHPSRAGEPEGTKWCAWGAKARARARAATARSRPPPSPQTRSAASSSSRACSSSSRARPSTRSSSTSTRARTWASRRPSARSRRSGPTASRRRSPTPTPSRSASRPTPTRCSARRSSRPCSSSSSACLPRT